MGYTWDQFRKWLSAREEASRLKAPHPLGEVGRLLGDLVQEGRVPGLAIQVCFRGETWFVAGFGKADIETGTAVLPETTVFRIASISKPITATALALLVAEGVLQLDEDVRAYVPEFPKEHGLITLRQLASHTAGIRGYRGKEFALNRPMNSAESLELFAEDPLLFPPGKGYHYNSFDFVLLSLAMQRATGMPFHELVAARVLKPLSMNRTEMETPGQPVPGQAHFYSRFGKDFRRAVPVDTRYKLAGGGYLSTVSDICRLGTAYLNGAIASPDSLSPFLTSCQVEGQPTHYGLGWQVSRDSGGRPFYGHVGNTVGAYSNFFVYPSQELVIAMLVNCSVPGVQPVLDQVVDAIHRSLPDSA
jgi:CubicO group peptidase (beta-lactamase class C family)